jgi:predicted permease
LHWYCSKAKEGPMLKTVRKLLTRNRQEQEAQDELHFHVEKETEKNIAAGMLPDEARRQALIAFGGLTQTRESLREVHGGSFFEAVLQDARYGLRMLRKTPGFTGIAVLTLALGIGANTAIFSLIDAVLFRSMPIPDPKELLVFQWQARKGPQTHGYMNFGECTDQSDGDHPSGCSLPLPFLKEVQEKTGLFSHVAGFASWQQLALSGNGPASMIRGLFVSGDYFPTLGVRAHLGRLFVANDDATEAPAVAVLNYGYWQSAFGGSASAIGKTIRLNGVPFTIIGVTEPRFDALTLANKYEIWVPLARRSSLIPQWKARGDQMDSFWMLIIGRVKPGVTVERAQAAVSLIFRNEMVSGERPVFKAESEPRIRLALAAQTMGGSQENTLHPLYILMLCVSAVLLIACANVAGLLLARSAGRQREVAVRLALGASRGRIILQLLTESVLLADAGGLLGLVIAMWGARALQAMVAAGNYYPPNFSAQIDWRVLAFTAGVSLLTGIVFGLAPALRGSDIGLTSSLKAGSGDAAMGTQNRHHRITSGGILVAVQMALAIVVLVTAGLLVRTLNNLRSIDPGFEARGLLLFGVDPRLAGYKDARLDNLYRDLQQKFAVLPGVKSSTYSWMPLMGGGLSQTSFHRPGTPVNSKEQVDVDQLPVGPNFFATMRIAFLTGHDFSPADFATAAANAANSEGKTGASPTPAIVNQTFVRKFYAGVNPLGQFFGDAIPDDPSEPRDPGYVVVGVTGDVKDYTLRREIMPTIYVPNIGGDAYFELRTAGDPSALISGVRNIVRHENDDLALFRISTQTEAIDRQLASERLTAQLSSFFGLLALVLACLGLYGLLSYEVTRRTREIGIRMAVGAQSHNVVGLVLTKAMGLIIAGAIAGIAVAVGVTRFLASFLYGVKAGDPITLLAVAALLALVALAACYIPARRATKVDPLVALRYE